MIFFRWAISYHWPAHEDLKPNSFISTTVAMSNSGVRCRSISSSDDPSHRATLSASALSNLSPLTFVQTGLESNFPPTCQSAMCRTVYFKSVTCDHRWVGIGQPCEKDSGFDKCGMLKNQRILPFTVGGPIDAVAKSCPVCDTKDDYDGNQIRVVQADRIRFRYQLGPTRRVYFDSSCCIIM